MLNMYICKFVKCSFSFYKIFLYIFGVKFLKNDKIFKDKFKYFMGIKIVFGGFIYICIWYDNLGFGEN